MTDDLDAALAAHPADQEAAVTVTPSKPRPHRHVWQRAVFGPDGAVGWPAGSFQLEAGDEVADYCWKCRRRRNPELIVVEFDVPGIPAPQGSLRAFARRGGGRPIVTADNARTRPWKDAVVWHARQEHAQVLSPVVVDIEFRLPRPKGHFGRLGLRLSAPPFPVVKPDLDKLARAVLDALTEAGTVFDDAQVVELRVSKVYGEPGAHIRVASR